MKRSGSKHSWLIASVTIPFCWLFMQWTHELGHVVGAIVTDGEVQRVVLHPFGFSRTDVQPSPSPLIVVWAGPIGGSVFGCLFALLWMTTGKSRRYLVLLSAGSCLLANAAYIGIGALVPEADAAVMISLGTPRWIMAAYGIIAGIPGYMLVRQGIRSIAHADRTTKSWFIDVLVIGSPVVVMSAIGYLLFPGP